jgi:hypothetical protein
LVDLFAAIHVFVSPTSLSNMSSVKCVWF